MFRWLLHGAGFECATGWGKNAHREWIDRKGRGDGARYARRALIAGRSGAARRPRRRALEAMRWPLIDRDGRYDFALGRAVRAEAAEVRGARYRERLGGDLLHYGYPADVDLSSGTNFPDRFCRLPSSGGALRFAPYLRAGFSTTLRPRRARGVVLFGGRAPK